MLPISKLAGAITRSHLKVTSNMPSIDAFFFSCAASHPLLASTLSLVWSGLPPPPPKKMKEVALLCFTSLCFVLLCLPGSVVIEDPQVFEAQVRMGLIEQNASVLEDAMAHASGQRRDETLIFQSSYAPDALGVGRGTYAIDVSEGILEY